MFTFPINLMHSGEAPATPAFRFRVKTDNAGTSASDQFSIPTISTGTYTDVEIDFGDGDTHTMTAWNDSEMTHTYPSAGEYDIVITATLFSGWRFNYGLDKKKLILIEEWGPFRFGNDNTFNGADQMTITAIDPPTIAPTNLDSAFSNCDGLIGSITSLENMDTSAVTNMRFIWYGANYVNMDMSNWDMSSVTNLSGACYGAYAFNRSLATWTNTAPCTADDMFRGNSAYNSAWFSAGKVSSLFNGFRGATIFNQPIGNMDWSSVTTVDHCFYTAPAFNQPLSDVNSSSLTGCRGFLRNTTAFDQVIDMDLSAATNMTYFLAGTSISTANYDATIEYWHDDPDGRAPSPQAVDMGSSTYTLGGSVETKYNALVTAGFSFTDGGGV